MTTAILVSLVAAVGAVCRYVVDVSVQRLHRSAFPYGTVLINLVGSFVLGLVTGLAVHHGLGIRATAVAGIGFCGGFTTFSTWTWETLALVDVRLTKAAVVNVVGSLALGLALAAAGLGVALW